MSHNLYFRTVRPNGSIDFPVQLPTEISKKIIQTSSLCDRLSIIRDYLYDCEWDSVAVDGMIRRIDWMMQREDLILSIN